MIAFSHRLIFGAAISALLSACGYIDSNRSAAYETKVLQDFAANRSEAVAHYKHQWQPQNLVAEQMVVASELMLADPYHYDEYYRYVTNGLKSPDRRIETAAVRAMRNTHGPESIRTLFALSGSNDEEIAHAATDSIRSRYSSASYSTALESDAQLIREMALERHLSLDRNQN